MKTIRIKYTLAGTIEVADDVIVNEGDTFRNDEDFCRKTGAQTSDTNVLDCSDIEITGVDED